MNPGSLALVAGLLLGGCNPQPVVPVVVEAGDASPCQVDDAITANRMIRTDSGKALVLPGCPDGGH